MDPNPYAAPRETNDSEELTGQREPESWIGIMLWIVTLGLGAIVVAGIAGPNM